MIGYEQWRKDKDFRQRSDSFAERMRIAEREEEAKRRKQEQARQHDQRGDEADGR